MTHWNSPPTPLDESPWGFPHHSNWPDDDLVAIGADLNPSTVLAGYRAGLFPMGIDEPRVLAWWSPDPRGIIPLDDLRVTRSLRQSAKHFEVRVDTRFGEVIRGCADAARKGAWIDDEILGAYTRLHQLGWAHSVEVYSRDGALAGGLYGVRIGRFFAGESMFHRQRDVSKVALIGLVELMRASGMALLDVQWRTDHLASLGAIEIERTEYLAKLREAIGSG